MLHNLFKMYIIDNPHKKIDQLFAREEEGNAMFAFMLNYI